MKSSTRPGGTVQSPKRSTLLPPIERRAAEIARRMSDSLARYAGKDDLFLKENPQQDFARLKHRRIS